MEPRAIVRVSLVHADGSIKSRPALLLKRSPPFNDWLLCIISTRLHNEVKGTDLLLTTAHPDFPLTHLMTNSVVRVTQLFTVSNDKIEGKIGAISNGSFDIIIQNLTRFLNSRH